MIKKIRMPLTNDLNYHFVPVVIPAKQLQESKYNFGGFSIVDGKTQCKRMAMQQYCKVVRRREQQKRIMRGAFEEIQP